MKRKKTVTNEQRVEMVIRAKDGDPDAFTQYAALNEGLFNYIIGRYFKLTSEADLDDLKQEALLGLHKGIQAYNPDKASYNKKPEGYIFSWVRAYVSRYVKKYICSKATALSIDDCNDNTIDTLIFNSAESITNESYMEMCGLASAPDKVTEFNDTQNVLRDYMQTLPWKHRVIAQYRILHRDKKKSLREIGEMFGVSHERVRQIELEVKHEILEFAKSQGIV
jgi:RNA polymerase sigma factor (sigma-70 family)